MRKLLWVSLTGLTLLAGGVTTAAYLAIHHPDPVPDHLLSNATPTLQPCHQDDEGPICASRPVSTDVAIGRGEAVPTGDVPAPIVIPEQEGSVRPESGTHEHLLVPARDPGTAESVATPPVLMPYCDGAPVAQAARPRTPAVMQPVGLTSEPQQMDHVRECEHLPMPCPAEESVPLEGAEEQEEPGTSPMPTGAAGKLIRGMEQLLKRSGETPAASEAPSDGRHDSHHHHSSGCPYPGRSACPIVPRAQPSNPGEGKQSLLRQIRILPRPEGFGERTPPLAVDTAEMRPEDRPAGETTPGAL